MAIHHMRERSSGWFVHPPIFAPIAPVILAQPIIYKGPN